MSSNKSSIQPSNVVRESDLTPDQERGLDAVINWTRQPARSHFVLAGYAGTGKTTLLSLLRGKLRAEKKSQKVAFCTFTGKAAHVLRQKLVAQGAVFPGDTCSTIHHLIYKPDYDDHGMVQEWTRVSELKCDLIIIDEASMVPERIWQDLLSFGIPILAVGDHGQLPPIDDKFDLMRKPDMKLEKIHRQAAENPIIDIAHRVRRGIKIPNGHYGESVIKMSRSDSFVMDDVEGLLSRSDVDRLVLCGINKTRVGLNQRIRQLLHYESDLPQAGERVICLKNNYMYGIFNGMQGVIESIAERDASHYDIVVQIDGDLKPFAGVAIQGQFGQLKTLSFQELKEIPNPKDTPGGATLFDWGYALTVHKAQGSEADQVVLFEERMSFYDDELWNRWLYTAVTRARSELYWISD